MPEDGSDGDTTQYSFEVDSELWNRWKDKVPRSKHLDEAIIDLIKNDLEDDSDD